MKSISPAVSGKTFARRAELFSLIVVSSPRRRFSEPEADQEKETSLCDLCLSRHSSKGATADGSNERSEWVVRKEPKAFPL
jgi:hypothetical protein